MQESAKSFTRSIKHLAGSPVLLHYTLPLLMIVLIIGTIAQKYIGLYQATKLYFFAPVIWLGPIPVPGMPLLLALIFLNLTVKIIFQSPWVKHNAGVIITHIGAALLLIGGLLTALFSHEGYMELYPEQTVLHVSDYHKREIYVVDQNGQSIGSVPYDQISNPHAWNSLNLPFSVKILSTCQNCAISGREIDQTDTRSYFGMARHMQLLSKPLAHLNEDNMAGITMHIQNTQDNQDGVYLALEYVDQYPEIKHDNITYKIGLRRQRRILPFSIELIEFKKDVHPETDLARSYSSRVRIIDGSSRWESTISMNNPLRYKGYTFYQSSFISTPDGEISVLTAVWNIGRSFPYISGLMMCLGLVVHTVMRCQTMRQKNA